MTAGAARPNRAVLGEWIESRTMCACIAAAAGAHVTLTAAGLGGWPCPVRQALGIPCPGCGLGRASVLLLHGQWAESLQVHAFAAPVLATLALLTVAIVLPRQSRTRLAAAVTSLERRWPLAPAVLGALLLYWLLRFALDARGFIQLTA
jgi:hypothetical protein